MHQPESLFKIVLNFISDNIENVDSLEDFPEQIGQIIFKQMLNKNKILCPRTIRTFTMAYKGDFLSALSFSNHLALSEYFEPLTEMLHYIKALDLSNCFLGDNHEILMSISQLECLETLNLSNNNLSDTGLRKLFLPRKIFNKGLPKLQHLNIAENLVSDKLCVWLKPFDNLDTLMISSDQLTVAGLSKLWEDKHLQPTNEAHFPEIQTNGWGKELIDFWINLNILHPQTKKLKFYKFLKLKLVPFPKPKKLPYILLKKCPPSLSPTLPKQQAITKMILEASQSELQNLIKLYK